MKLRSGERRRENAIDASDLPPITPHPDADIIDRVAARRAILELPDTLRPIFILKEVEGYSHREIADLLGISPGASAVRLNRAWALLLQSTKESDETQR
jgi:DNA-directed RNA polymerase specialized sigma24 family protein